MRFNWNQFAVKKVDEAKMMGYVFQTVVGTMWEGEDAVFPASPFSTVFLKWLFLRV